MTDKPAKAPASSVETALSYGRAVVSTPIFLGTTLAFSAIALGAAAAGSHRTIDGLIAVWSRLTLGLFNIRVDAAGLENVPPGRGCVFLFNHQSHMDIPVIHRTLDRTLRFGAKIELFKVPVFGQAMRAAGVLPITRDDPTAVFQVYKDAAARFADGWSYILAPEGTRQDEPRIGRFKKGPFRFAVDAQVPIVPIVLKGTIDVLPKHRLAINAGRWSRTVSIRFLPPIETSGLTAADVPRLLEDVRERMVSVYQRL